MRIVNVVIAAAVTAPRAPAEVRGSLRRPHVLVADISDAGFVVGDAEPSESDTRQRTDVPGKLRPVTFKAAMPAVVLGLVALLTPAFAYFAIGTVEPPSHVSTTVAWAFGWFLCVLVMNVANKMAVQESPTALAAAQMAFAVVAMVLCWPALELRSLQDCKELSPWLMVCVFFAVLLVSSLYGFQFESISTVVMMGSLRPLYAHAIEWACFKEAPDTKQVAGCFLIVLGSIGYFADSLFGNASTTTAATVTSIGLIALVLNGVVGSIDRCYQRLYLHHRPLAASRSALVVTMNAGGFVFLLLLLPVWREELTRLAARADLWARGDSLADCCWVLLSCLTGVAIGFAGIGLQKHVTASAFLVLATGSRVALITLDHLWFQYTLSLPTMCGLAVVIFGTALHSYRPLPAEKL
jgi:drug/metabolite transporter (DMT)-like permease